MNLSVVSRNPDHLDVFLIDGAGRARTSWWHDGQEWSGRTNGWRDLAGNFLRGAAISAVARTPDHLDIFAVDRSGRVCTAWWHEGGGWSGWDEIGGYFPAGAPISVVARRPDHLDLFLVGNNGHVFTSWWHEGSDWSGRGNRWTDLGGDFQLRARVTALHRRSDHVDLVVNGNDEQVYTAWWQEGSRWSNWRAIGGRFLIRSPATATARRPDHLDAFIMGEDRRVYTSWWHEGTDWSGIANPWRNIGGEDVFYVWGPVEVVARRPDHLDLFVVGDDGEVYTSWWHESPNWAPWRSIGGVGVPRMPLSAVARMPDHLDVFVVAHGRVWTSWWHEGNDWSGIGNRWHDIGAY